MSSIDYDLKKIKAIVLDIDGVLSPQTVDIDSEGEPLRKTNVHDGLAITRALKCGLKLCIISGARTERIRLRFSKLGIKDIYTDVSDKLPRLQQWMEQNGLRQDEVAYLGDDLPDAECLKYAGLGCCPSDATADAFEYARWISAYEGGRGCVRQLIEEVMRCQSKW